MKKILLLVAVLVSLGMFATPKAEAFVGVSIGIPVPGFYGGYYGPGPYYYGGYGYYGRPYGYWGGGYWHGRYWRGGYYGRGGYYRGGYGRGYGHYYRR